jgi:hypothetical protein
MSANEFVTASEYIEDAETGLRKVSHESNSDKKAEDFASTQEWCGQYEVLQSSTTL